MTEDTLNLLRWSVNAGADEAVGDKPCDYFARSAEALLSSVDNKTSLEKTKNSSENLSYQTTVASASSPSPISPVLEDGINDAKKAADAARSLDELKQSVLNFTGCTLKNTAINTVFADGFPHARVMLVGEAPGADEDRIGLPFVGQSGKLLDKIFASIGLTRADGFYISNIIPWRPPGNRQPTLAEMAVCTPFIEKHIELINPDFLVLLGGTAATALLNTSESVSRLRGRWLNYEIKATGKKVSALVTFHPAFLLRSPLQKKAVWRDVLLLKERLQNNG